MAASQTAGAPCARNCSPSAWQPDSRLAVVGAAWPSLATWPPITTTAALAGMRRAPPKLQLMHKRGSSGLASTTLRPKPICGAPLAPFACCGRSGELPLEPLHGKVAGANQRALAPPANLAGVPLADPRELAHCLSRHQRAERQPQPAALLSGPSGWLAARQATCGDDSRAQTLARGRRKWAPASASCKRAKWANLNILRQSGSAKYLSRQTAHLSRAAGHLRARATLPRPVLI